MVAALEYTDKTPGIEEYIALRAAAGLSPKSAEAARIGLANSWYSVCVRQDGRLVGMGRVIGDGGCFFQVVDVAVCPGLHRQGIGSGIMDRITRYVRAHAPASSYVSMIADGGAPKLYRKFGFELTAPESVGMYLKERNEK